MFTLDNTEGYTQEQLDALNNELQQRIEKFKKSYEAEHGIECAESDLAEIEQDFNDEVARR
jgi:uncharacterized protein involved in exopolysaccharide biosynthesis